MTKDTNMAKYIFFTMAGLAAALPLNINLGAYSPALVVGTLTELSPGVSWTTDSANRQQVTAKSASGVTKTFPA